MRTQRRTAALTLLFSIAVASLDCAATCPPGPGEVCWNGANYGTISAAVSAATSGGSPGATIYVGSGTFTEGLLYVRGTTIVGAGISQTTIQCSSVYMTNDASDSLIPKLQDLKVEASASGYTVLVYDDDGASLTRVDVSGLNTGVFCQ